MTTCCLVLLASQWAGLFVSQQPPPSNPMATAQAASLAALENMRGFTRFRVRWTASRGSAPTHAAALAGNVTPSAKSVQFVLAVDGNKLKVDSLFKSEPPNPASTSLPSMPVGGGAVAFPSQQFIDTRLVCAGEDFLEYSDVAATACYFKNDLIKLSLPRVEPWAVGENAHWMQPGVGWRLNEVARGEWRLESASPDQVDGIPTLRLHFRWLKRLQGYDMKEVLHLDPERGFLPLRAEFEGRDGEGKLLARATWYLRETKEYQGRHFPTNWLSIVETANKTLEVKSMKVEELSVDAPLSHDEFTLQIPGGTKVWQGKSRTHFLLEKSQKIGIADFPTIEAKLQEAAKSSSPVVGNVAGSAGWWRFPWQVWMSLGAGVLLAGLLFWQFARRRRLAKNG